VERTFDLTVALLLLFGAMKRNAELRIEDRKEKHLPTASDLNPSLRFVNNPVLVALAENKLLEKEAEKRRINWVGEGELLTRMHRQFEQSEEYKRYMAAPAVTFNDHRAIVLHLFMEHIANFEPLHDHFEGRSIYWLEDLDLACSLVKRTIEQMRDGAGEELGLATLLKPPAEEKEFVSQLYRRTIEQSDEHGREIASKASNWEEDRIAVSDMILMKMALTEARAFNEIPVKVTLNEYIEIAKAYSTPKSSTFVNGILDKLFAEMKENGSIRKVGRGLLES
jgi:N utilization substance protein B